MKRLPKRLLASLLIIAMAFSVLAVSVFAAEEAEVEAPEAESVGLTAAADPAEESEEQPEQEPAEPDAEEPAGKTEELPEAETVPEEAEDAEEPAVEGAPVYSWKKSDDAWHLYNDKGVRQSGFVKAGEDLFYLDPEDDDNAASDWEQIDGVWYFFDPETRIAAKGHTYVRGSYYFFDEDTCAMAESGLVIAKDGARYYATDSGRMDSGWLYIGGDWYYFGASYGNALTGLWTIGGNKYYFNEDGQMQTGLLRITDEAAGVENALFYFTSSGAAMSGWYQDGSGDWYYFGSTSKQALTGFWTINKVGRYFDKNGVLVYGSGVCTCDDGRTYYFSGSVVKTGWIKNSDGTWSYYNSSTGRRAQNSAWVIGYKRYYFDEMGRMFTDGFATVNGVTYCFGSNGAGMSGWVTYDGNYYYFAPYGCEMVTGWQTVRGTTYYFYQEGDEGGPVGAMAYSTTIDGCEIGANGAAATTPENEDLMVISAQSYSSDTDYLILVDTTNCRTGVFYGSRGNWEMIYDWACTCGKSGHLTPTGVYTTSSKYYSFGSAYYTCYYGTTFLYKDGYEWLFHSLLYYPGTYTVKGVQLGQHASNGCVRLAYGNAKWIYDNIPTGTKVVSY